MTTKEQAACDAVLDKIIKGEADTTSGIRNLCDAYIALKTAANSSPHPSHKQPQMFSKAATKDKD